MKSVIRAILMGSAVALMVIAPSPADAENPEPTPSPEPTKAVTKRPKTLSDLAGGIKLQQPEGKKDGGVVIDNSNLKAMGAGAVVSEGKASNVPGARIGSDDEDAAEHPRDTREMAQLRDKIKLLEEQMEVIGGVSKERQKTNMYTGAGPQYRPPGVADPIDTESKRIEGELRTAKMRLNGLERKAKRTQPRY